VEGIMNLRLIHDPPASGVWNMAVDEMMLDTVVATSQPILRFYAWDEPTLSLGYFQTLEERQSHSASMHCPVVRRSTGGGAIVHDQEITYSIALPIADRWSGQATEVYETFHESLVAALTKLQVAATLCPETLVSLQPEFLCFRRRAKGDVLVGPHKIAGSAQRRRQGALLQHGSVILGPSQAAPEIAGLKELGVWTPREDFIALWTAEIVRHTPAIAGKASEWSPAEIEAAQSIQQTRFETPVWLSRRST
jgi:lipoyl(octanoyl) transferase